MAGDALESAKGIDAGLAEDLRAVGVHDLRELRAIGAADAWERLLAADLRDTLASRVALEAAEAGRSPRFLDPEARERCAAHVRRRRSGEQAGSPARSSKYTIAASPQPGAVATEADRRRARIVHAIVAATVVLFLLLLLVAT